MAQQILMISDEERFAAMIAEKVVGMMKPQASSVEQHLTHKEAAAFLKIDRHTLTRRLADGTYPVRIVHINGSRKVYYKSELKDLLTRKK